MNSSFRPIVLVFSSTSKARHSSETNQLSRI
ncbi:hypothetical protein FOMG_19310 [Fusarium oxysporum f. sp. melonis 26406]|uniref:Uncharacterized protein n=1 Tax=Fusarium oxysporum f. sp. melonis 26406 TaxID=1089452 RepID=W9YXP3_FUSOX|nr:hypothetical protein FOMG_19477 [Fusarium oxysporum f. sp. melonis 26406]EXK23940.1 hypothetical protein FOMG_19310 [Fusarium oxysporum f. sp. melonis 26406]